MNATKMKRLSKSGIEYLDFAWNFYSGCENSERGICPLDKNCWAFKRTQRFKHHYPNGFESTFYPEAFLSPLHLKKPSIIGVAFMGDLFGDWVDPNKKFHSVMPSGKASLSMSLKGWIFTTIEQCPQHTFLFLTKCPWNLPKWGKFPDNCWVGVTATDVLTFSTAMVCLGDIKARVKYLSIEPLLAWGDYPADVEAIEQWVKGFKLYGIGWVIIGTMTCGGDGLAKLSSLYPQLTPMPYGNRYMLQPKISWVEELVRACDKAGVKVFQKNNLRPLLGKSLRQELPQ